MPLVKLLNSRDVISSKEDVLVYLYIHTNFFPEAGLTITASIYNSSIFLDDVVLEENFFLPGVYFSNIETALGVLPPDNYTIVLLEGGSEIGSFGIKKGPDISKSEALFIGNKRIETTLSEDIVTHRNVVEGSLDSINVKTTTYLEPSFDNPLTDGVVYFSYKNPTPRSDVLLSSPVITDPDSVTPIYSDNFNSIQWLNPLYKEPFENSNWYESIFSETFGDNNWL